MSELPGYHVGRLYTDDRLRGKCPCEVAPCGQYVFDAASADCQVHNWKIWKDMPQTHPAYACPGPSTP